MKLHGNNPGIVKAGAAKTARNEFKTSSFSGRLRTGVVASALFAASVTGCAETSYSDRQSTPNLVAKVDQQKTGDGDRLDTTIAGVLAATGFMTAIGVFAYYSGKKEMPSERVMVLFTLDILASAWLVGYAATDGRMGGGPQPLSNSPFPYGSPTISLPGHR